MAFDTDQHDYPDVTPLFTMGGTPGPVYFNTDLTTVGWVAGSDPVRSLDWTGLGVCDASPGGGRRAIAAISDTFAVDAHHLKSGSPATFFAPDGTRHVRTFTEAADEVGGSDIRLVQLDAPLPAEVTPFSVADDFAGLDLQKGAPVWILNRLLCVYLCRSQGSSPSAGGSHSYENAVKNTTALIDGDSGKPAFLIDAASERALLVNTHLGGGSGGSGPALCAHRAAIDAVVGAGNIDWVAVSDRLYPSHDAATTPVHGLTPLAQGA